MMDEIEFIKTVLSRSEERQRVWLFQMSIHNSDVFKDTQLLQEEVKPDSFSLVSMADFQIMEVKKVY